jgi:hypothetical protein
MTSRRLQASNSQKKRKEKSRNQKKKKVFLVFSCFFLVPEDSTDTQNYRHTELQTHRTTDTDLAFPAVTSFAATLDRAKSSKNIPQGRMKIRALRSPLTRDLWSCSTTFRPNFLHCTRFDKTCTKHIAFFFSENTTRFTSGSLCRNRYRDRASRRHSEKRIS